MSVNRIPTKPCGLRHATSAPTLIASSACGHKERKLHHTVAGVEFGQPQGHAPSPSPALASHRRLVEPIALDRYLHRNPLIAPALSASSRLALARKLDLVLPPTGSCAKTKCAHARRQISTGLRIDEGDHNNYSRALVAILGSLIRGHGSPKSTSTASKRLAGHFLDRRLPIRGTRQHLISRSLSTRRTNLCSFSLELTNNAVNADSKAN